MGIVSRMINIKHMINYPISSSTTCHLMIHFLFILLTICTTPTNSKTPKFPIKEATIKDLQTAFHENKLSSKELVQFYLNRIQKLNPVLRGVIEVNPDALHQAEQSDKRRESAKNSTTFGCLGGLDGIPVLLKDLIGTKDKMNTTAGSYALLGCVVGRDAGVVRRLRNAGAIILGKASLSEWAHFRSFLVPNGWCARTGQGQNPYNISGNPCGSSSGSAIAAAANLATITVGTETDASILCPCSTNSVVGIKPTVGLTSRAGIIPISPTQDTVGPICRSVADATYVLDAIVGYDPYDSKATSNAIKYIPQGGYAQFLNLDGLNGKRLGIVTTPFFHSIIGFPEKSSAFNQHFETLREKGAILVDDLEILNIDEIMSSNIGLLLIQAEFKVSLNSYLKGLVKSPVRSLADVIDFNNKNAQKEMIKEYGQENFLLAEATNGIGQNEKKYLEKLGEWSREGFEKVMVENSLDAIISPESSFSTVLAIGGFPGISVPAGYDKNGVPFGICFGGLKGTEPALIEIAYGFEQATKIRVPPSIHMYRERQTI